MDRTDATRGYANVFFVITCRNRASFLARDINRPRDILISGQPDYGDHPCFRLPAMMCIWPVFSDTLTTTIIVMTYVLYWTHDGWSWGRPGALLALQMLIFLWYSFRAF